MVKVTRLLAEQVYHVQIGGVTQQYQIVPEITAKLREELYFWENLNQNSVEGCSRYFNSNNSKIIYFRYLDQLRQRLIGEREAHQQKEAELQARIRELEQNNEVQRRRLRRSRMTSSVVDHEIDSGDEGTRRVEELTFADDEASSETSEY